MNRAVMDALTDKYAHVKLSIAALEKVKKAQSESSKEYLKAARVAFSEIKRLLRLCNNHDSKQMVQKRLSEAFFHLKRAEELCQVTCSTARGRIFTIPSENTVKPLIIFRKKSKRTKPKQTAKSKQKKRSVWTLSAGGFETNRRRH